MCVGVGATVWVLDAIDATQNLWLPYLGWDFIGFQVFAVCAHAVSSGPEVDSRSHHLFKTFPHDSPTHPPIQSQTFADENKRSEHRWLLERLRVTLSIQSELLPFERKYHHYWVDWLDPEREDAVGGESLGEPCLAVRSSTAEGEGGHFKVGNEEYDEPEDLKFW